MRKHRQKPGSSKPAPVGAKPASTGGRGWPWLALCLILVFTAAVRWRIAEVALDRDEGEYAYIAQQMLRGVPPYESGYAMKPPGIYLAYAVILLVFGESTQGIHLGAMVVNAASIVLVFLIARRVFDEMIGVVAAALFALLSVSPAVHGGAAQSEHFVVAPALLGVWLLVRNGLSPGPLSIGRIAAAGTCLGAACVVKQHGFGYGLFGICLLMLNWWGLPGRRPWQLSLNLAALAAGALIPALLVMLGMYLAGVFEDFWFCTVRYASAYATGVPFDVGLGILERNFGTLLLAWPLTWLMAFVGLVGAFRVYDLRRAAFLITFVLCTFLSTCPGMFFRHHYFLLMLPAVACAAAVGCAVAARELPRVWGAEMRSPIPLTLALAALVLVGDQWRARHYLFSDSPMVIEKNIYGSNLFSEIKKVARYVAEQSKDDSPVLVLGSEPEFFFYTGRRSATRHIYMYPLFELNPFARQMQEQLITDWEQADPEWLIYEKVMSAYLPWPGADLWLLEEMPKRLDNYDLVGVLDLFADVTIEKWGPDAANYNVLSTDWIGVYRRKSSAPRKAH